jgi:hypothetical protein
MINDYATGGMRIDAVIKAKETWLFQDWKLICSARHLTD